MNEPRTLARVIEWRIVMSLILAAISSAVAADADAGPLWCHEVRAGETLASIARRHHASLHSLRTLNRLAPDVVLNLRAMVMLPTAFDLRRGRLELSRPGLRATPGRLARESATAVRDGLSRMRDSQAVARFRHAGLLVSVPAESATYYVAGVAPALRVARPWTKYFVEQVAAAFHELFRTRLRITALTRTVLTQRALRRVNPNAAPASGPVQSTHLTGAAVDISKHSMSDAQIAWLRTIFVRLQRRAVIQVVEEFQQPHFHVMVRSRYLRYGSMLGHAVLIGGC